MGGPYGLDFGAVMLMAMAADADVAMLRDVLPDVETAILTGTDSGDGID